MPRTFTSKAYAAVVGKRLRSARESLGLTQREVGARMGATGSYIARVEAGRANLTLGQLANLAEALNVVLEIDFRLPADTAEQYERAV